MSTTVARRSILTAASSALLVPVTARATSALESASETPRPRQSPGLLLEQQSPVDVRVGNCSVGDDLPSLDVRYQPATTVQAAYLSRERATDGGCATRGSEDTVQVTVAPGDGEVILDGVVYALQQFHFHTPSEHSFEGVRAPLEQHFVHGSDDGRILVIGLLLFPGRATEVDRVLERLPAECDAEAVELEGLDLRSLLPRHILTVRYEGSLTTAPYTEGVQWFLTQPGTASASGIGNVQALFPEGNTREVHPLNGRQLLVQAP